MSVTIQQEKKQSFKAIPTTKQIPGKLVDAVNSVAR